jgi:hypothetical protein
MSTMNAAATAENRPAFFLVNREGQTRSHSTHEYQGCIQIVVGLLEEIPVVFVRLSIEHVVETLPRINFRWFVRIRGPFQHLTQGI